MTRMDTPLGVFEMSWAASQSHMKYEPPHWIFFFFLALSTIKLSNQL